MSRQLGQGQARRLRAGARAGLASCDLLRRVARMTTAVSLLEIFSGWSELSFQAARRPGWRCLQPFELLFGDDLLTAEGQADLWRVLEAEDVGLVTALEGLSFLPPPFITTPRRVATEAVSVQ